jgi:TolB-like protein
MIPTRTHRTRSWLALVLASLVLASAALPGAPAPAAPGQSRMRVAVMDFTNAAGQELAHLGKGLQSMLITDLTEVERFELVERERLGDIRAELELGQSELIDKKTAVRIGKLAGATHLIAGSYTVAGARMRIDARLFAVDTGTIVHAAKVEGEKDGFFELEKDLIKQLVGATGVAVTPKERARMGKIHTADFQAFEKFSRGIDLFDAQRYDEAVQALRQASAMDADFELARLTLAEYERLARTMRTRAGAAGVAETELARLRADRDRKRETEVVERLFALAARKGEQQREGRVLALALLMEIYSANYHGWEFLRRLEETGDEFTIARTRDWLQQSYWAEASEHLDQVPPFGITVQMPPTTVDEIDKVFAQMRETARKATARGAGDALSSNLEYNVAGMARRLHLDRGQQTELFEKLVRHGIEHGEDDRLKPRWLLELAESYQDVLELDRSTRQLVLLGRMTADAETLEKAAERMEENRDLAQLLDQRGPLQAYMREFLLNSVSRPKLHPIRRARELFVGKDPTEKMMREIDHDARQWNADDYLLLGEQPMWLLQGSFKLRTGPRNDRYRAGEIRYHVRADAHSDEGGMLGIWGAGPRQDFRVRFRVRYAAPRDYWLARSGKDRAELTEGRAAHARVGFLFGLRNIETPTAHDRARKLTYYPDPMTGYAVLIDDEGIALARVRAEHRSGSSHGHRELVPEVIRRIQVDTRSLEDLEVTVEVEKGRVTIDGAGKRATIQLSGQPSGQTSGHAPGDQSGYLGLTIHGRGYAAWSPIGSVAAGARAK